MNIEIKEIEGKNIAVIIADEIVVGSTQEALDILANSGYLDATRIVIYEKNISPDFFDLRTGIAGDILQKFSNYNFQLAIVGDFGKYSSKSLRDFIFESNKTGRIFFVSDIQHALDQLVNK